MTAVDIVNNLIMEVIQSSESTGVYKDGFLLDRELLKLRRITDPKVEEILAVAKERNIEMEFNSTKRVFSGIVDLDAAVLNERQSAFLSRIKKRRKESGL